MDSADTRHQAAGAICVAAVPCLPDRASAVEEQRRGWGVQARPREHNDRNLVVLVPDVMTRTRTAG